MRTFANLKNTKNTEKHEYSCSHNLFQINGIGEKHEKHFAIGEILLVFKKPSKVFFVFFVFFKKLLQKQHSYKRLKNTPSVLFVFFTVFFNFGSVEVPNG